MRRQVDNRPVRGVFVVATFVFAAAVFVGSHVLDIPGSLAELLRATKGVPILDLSPVFSVDDTYARIDAYGEEGRRLYQRFVITTDIVFPVVLASFLILLARFTVERVAVPASLRWVLLALPFGFLVADLLENLTIYHLLSAFPQRHEMAAGILPYLTLVKRLSLYGSVILPLGVLVVRFVFSRWTKPA